MTTTMEKLLAVLHEVMILPHTLEGVEPANSTEAQLVKMLRSRLEEGPLLPGDMVAKLYVARDLRSAPQKQNRMPTSKPDAKLTWGQRRFLQEAAPILEEAGPMSSTELCQRMGCSAGRVISNTRTLAAIGALLRMEHGWMSLVGLVSQADQLQELAARKTAEHSDRMTRNGQAGAKARAQSRSVPLAVKWWSQVEPVLCEGPISTSNLARRIGRSYDGVNRYLPVWLERGWVVQAGGGSASKIALPQHEERLKQAVQEATQARVEAMRAGRDAKARCTATKAQPAPEQPTTPKEEPKTATTQHPATLHVLALLADGQPRTARQIAQAVPSAHRYVTGHLCKETFVRNISQSRGSGNPARWVITHRGLERVRNHAPELLAGVQVALPSQEITGTCRQRMHALLKVLQEEALTQEQAGRVMGWSPEHTEQAFQEMQEEGLVEVAFEHPDMGILWAASEQDTNNNQEAGAA